MLKKKKSFKIKTGAEYEVLTDTHYNSNNDKIFEN